MFSPGPSPARKTLLVFIAGLCLLIVCLDKPAIQNATTAANSSQRELTTNALPDQIQQSLPPMSQPEEAPDLSPFTFATLWGHEKTPALAAFSKWAAEYIDASANAQSEMLPKGITLAQERRAAFK